MPISPIMAQVNILAQVNLDNGSGQSSHGYGNVEIEKAWPILRVMCVG